MAALTRADIILKADGSGKLQQVLGEYLPDDIMLSANIAIFSPIKPIQDSSIEPLTDFRGNDTANGIWYGVQMALTARNYTSLHDDAFIYHRPRGGAYNEPFRLSDFVGYIPDALPTLTGAAPMTAYRDIADNYNVSITVMSENNGIDVAGIMEDSGLDLQTCYPMILVGSKLAALKNTSFDDLRVTPLYYEGSEYTFFTADFSTLGLSEGDTARVTLCLVPYSTGNASPDFSGAWQDITGLTFTHPAFPVPLASGLSVTVENYGNYPPELTVVSPTSASTMVFTVGYSFADTPEENVTVEITATVNNGGTSMASTKTFTYTPGGAAAFWAFYWQSDFGFTPAEGSFIDVRISARYKYESGIYWRSTSASSTAYIENKSTGL